MKKIILIVTIGFLVISCSSSKKAVAENQRTQVSTTAQLSKKKSSENTYSKEVNHKINTIIQNYLGTPITSIARSEIVKTENGYQWKFMNVKTGENFTANSDISFSSIEIVKNKKS